MIGNAKAENIPHENISKRSNPDHATAGIRRRITVNPRLSAAERVADVHPGVAAAAVIVELRALAPSVARPTEWTFDP
jgi:hypothetical protein